MKKFLTITGIVVVVLISSGYGLFKYKNRGPDIDLYAYWQEQDPVPEGKTAVFIIGLSTQEDFDPIWWYNIYQHIAHNIIPWPARNFALADAGVALMDPDHDYSTVEFEPTRLVDRFGNFRNMDGVPFADHYWDPDQESLSTHRAYLEGVEARYDYVLNLPIEFYSENTDTLFYHAMVNYENFPGYDVYDVIDYPKSKWDEPHTKQFTIEGTEIHYLGVPAGPRYRPYVAQAMYEAPDSVLAN